MADDDSEGMLGPPPHPPPPHHPPPPPPPPPASSKDSSAGDIEEDCLSKRIIAPTNTRAIGTLITVQLKKGGGGGGGGGGLGFSITARDNHSGLDSPIYIKNILPGGAAFESGKLQPGDRLIQVDQVTLTGKSLSDATTIFKSVEVDAFVELVVSRQTTQETEREDFENLPAKVSSTAEECLVIPEQAFDLNESPVSCCHLTGIESNFSSQKVGCCNGATEDLMQAAVTLKLIHDGSDADQLGVRVKISRRKGSVGLHIRSILSGSLAEKDGQLNPNDRLTEVNGVPVINLARSAVVEIFRSVVKQSVRDGSAITITVIRPTLSVIPERGFFPCLPEKSARPTGIESSLSGQNVGCCSGAAEGLMQAAVTSTLIHDGSDSNQLMRAVASTSTPSAGTVESESDRFPNTCLEMSSKTSGERENDESPTATDEDRERSGDGLLAPVDRDGGGVNSELHSTDLFRTEAALRTCDVLQPSESTATGKQEGASCASDVLNNVLGGLRSETSAGGLFPGSTGFIDRASSARDEDLISDSDETGFRRDGFGRRSISEKRSTQEFLSRSEIYRNIKENRKKREIQSHELLPLLHENGFHGECPNTDSDKPSTNVVAPPIEDSASIQTTASDPPPPPHPPLPPPPAPPPPSPSADDRERRSFPPPATDLSSIKSYNDCASSTFPEEPGNDPGRSPPPVPSSGKSLKKFDPSTIRGFLKRGFSELFRIEKKTEISRCLQGGQNAINGNYVRAPVVQTSQRFMASDRYSRGSSLPRLKTTHNNSKDATAFSRAPPQTTPTQYYTTNTLPTAAPGAYFVRFQQLPSARNALPVHYNYPFTPNPVSSGFLGQNRFSVPPPNHPIAPNVAYSHPPPIYHPTDRTVAQQHAVRCKIPAIRLFHPVPSCRPSWNVLRQRGGSFKRVPFRDPAGGEPRPSIEPTRIA